jgi:hypothetical protein
MAEVVFMGIADFNRFRHAPEYRKRRQSRLRNSEHLDRKLYLPPAKRINHRLLHNGQTFL